MKSMIRALVACAIALALPTCLMAQDRRPVVAVSEIEDATNNNLSTQLTAMIQTAVAATNKFRIMERQGMDQLLAEQGRARTGLVTTNRPGRTGGFEGVDYLIYGTITSVNVRAQSNMGANFLASALVGNTNAGCQNQIATMELDVRITNAQTGEIRYVKRISETARSATNCGSGANIDTGVMLRAAADKVASGLVTTIFPIQIAAVQGDGTLMLNYGEGSLTTGQILNVFSRGEEIKDPSTGEVIGSTESKLGMIQVTEVTGRLSRAQPVTPFAQSPPVGAVARLASEEEVRAMTASQRRSRR